MKDPTLNEALAARGLRSEAIAARPLCVSQYAKRIVRVSDGVEVFVGKSEDTWKWLETYAS